MSKLFIHLLLLVMTTHQAHSAETLISVDNDYWNTSFTTKMNQMLPAIQKELAKNQNQCVDIFNGQCFGFFETVTIDGTKREKFSGMCKLSGNNCDINTDAGWQVMLEGVNDQFNFIKIIKTWKEN